MRVGVDVSILSGQMTGIGGFTLSLARSLACLYTEVEWVILGAPPNCSGLPLGENTVTHKCEGLTGWRRVVWQQVMLPRLASQYGLDVLYCPDFSRPIRVSAPVVNTIHDLSYYSTDDFFSLGNRTYKRLLTRLAVKKRSKIVADSEFTRGELARVFAINTGSVSVIYLGVDAAPKRTAQHEGSPFVLYVGTLEERKNLLTLIRAFSLLRAKNGFSHRLVLVGKPGRGFGRIQAAIRSCPCKRDIDMPGYVSRENVLQFYCGADAFVMPSMYEGFGLPVLEAMAAGTPVVCSTAASLPEVGGDAVEYFDPASPEEIASSLTRVLGSESLRFEMRRKGLERVKAFSWKKCAERYYEIFREAANA